MTEMTASSQPNNFSEPPAATPPSSQPGDLFNPPGIDFKPISFAYAKVRLLAEGLTTFLTISLVIGFVAFGLSSTGVVGNWIWIFMIVPIGIFLWLLWLIPRQVRAWGYFEGEKDFYLRRGIMFKKMWAVPYGRMQFVDVKQGPVERAFGIATVSLKTASQESDACVPGLVRAEADRIRETLTARGEAMRAGL